MSTYKTLATFSDDSLTIGKVIRVRLKSAQLFARVVGLAIPYSSNAAQTDSPSLIGQVPYRALAQVIRTEGDTSLVEVGKLIAIDERDFPIDVEIELADIA